MTIPDRERGYSIEPDTLIVHERYQDHAPRAMRTSAAGVGSYAKGRELIACEVCFPAPKPAKAKGKPKADTWREEPTGWVLERDPQPREGMTWVDDANGARWVANEDIEDAPITAAIVADMVERA